MNPDKVKEVLKAFGDEMTSLESLTKEIKNLNSTIVDSNEEMIATFVEGTKRIVKKPESTSAIKSLERTIVEAINSLKKGVGEVERAVKTVKLPSTVDFRATGAMLKLPIKELTRTINDFQLPKSAKDAIPVRLSDGEDFYKALDQIVQQISGGGASSYAFDRQDGGPTKAATVALTIGGKQRDALVVVNSDGSAVGGSSSSGLTTGATGTSSNVSGSASSVTLHAATSGRIKIVIFNDSAANLYIKYGTTASVSSFGYKLAPYDTLEENQYTGRIDGIWDSATGAARVTEVTA
jgi:hypothetical protein